MDHRTFRNFKIIRRCDKHYTSYHGYRPFLKADFHGRCAYCNLLDSAITTPFEIDHYIPRKEFEHKRDELECTYENLIYACKKCNDAKSSSFEGNIYSKELDNNLFYDPVKVDYNDIFYRTEYGGVASDDVKGRNMIQLLKLYRPIHNLAWLCEELLNTEHKLEQKMRNETDADNIAIIEIAKNKINEYYSTCRDIFIANYNNNSFTLALQDKS